MRITARRSCGPAVVIGMQLHDRTNRFTNVVCAANEGLSVILRSPIVDRTSLPKLFTASPVTLYFCDWLLPCAISECSWAVFE
jgi:hypothetical protein